MNERAKKILDFWFIETSPESHFKKNNEFDNKINEKFLNDYDKAANSEYDDWQNESESCLALIIIFDQFSRNLFRNNKKSFKFDNKARLITNEGIRRGYLKYLSEIKRHCMLLPLLHSEDISDHVYAQNLCEIHLKKHPQYQDIKKAWDRHTYIINKFGRYPHRNETLGRRSTKEEKIFLSEPNSSF